MALSLNLSSQSLQYQIGGTVPTAQSLVLNFDFYTIISLPEGYDNYKIDYIINSGNYQWLDLSSADILENNEINKLKDNKFHKINARSFTKKNNS